MTQSRLVTDAMFDHAHSQPKAAALRTQSDRVVTYKELASTVQKLRRGLRPGTRLAVTPRSAPHDVALILAAWSHSVSVVLMHRRLSAEQAKRTLQRTRPATVSVTGGRLYNLPTPAESSRQELLVGLASGTSGDPMPYARSHQSWLAAFQRSDNLLKLGPTDVVAVPGDIDHSYFLYALTHSLGRGAEVDLRGVQHSEWEKCTVAYLVPTIAAELLEAHRRLPKARAVLSSGLAWPAHARHDIRTLLPTRATVYNFYDSEELGFVSVSDGSGPDESVGRPFNGVTVTVQGTDGRPAKAGRVGDLWVDSDMLFDGYLDDSGEVVPSAAPVSVGDRGYIDDDDLLYLARRSSRMFTRGGLNVEPESIERVLRDHPATMQAACVALPDGTWGAHPLALVTLNRPLTVGALMSWCRRRLDSVHLPRRIIVVDSLPTDHRGKVDYVALSKRYGSSP